MLLNTRFFPRTFSRLVGIIFTSTAAAFYTFESEVDGKPVPEDEPVPDVTKMSVGLARLGSSNGIAKCRCC